MAATERRAEALWQEKRGAWVIKVQKDGVRKAFQSTTPAAKGKREAETKADEWLESGKSDMSFPLAWQQFLGYQLNHDGCSSYACHESDRLNGRSAQHQDNDTQQNSAAALAKMH